VCVCVSVCLLVTKWLKDDICMADLISCGYMWAPPGEYDWMIHAWQWCVLSWSYWLSLLLFAATFSRWHSTDAVCYYSVVFNITAAQQTRLLGNVVSTPVVWMELCWSCVCCCRVFNGKFHRYQDMLDCCMWVVEDIHFYTQKCAQCEWLLMM